MQKSKRALQSIYLKRSFSGSLFAYKSVNTSNLRIDGLYSVWHFGGLHPTVLLFSVLFVYSASSWNYLGALGPFIPLLNSITIKQQTGLEILISTSGP